MMFKSIAFEVTGDNRLNCTACEQRVTRILKSLEGIGEVRAQADAQRIEVLFDDRVVEPRVITDRLSAAGYETKVA